MTGFKLEEKTTHRRYQKLEFQLKDTTSTSTILPYKNPPGMLHQLSCVIAIKAETDWYPLIFFFRSVDL